MKNFILTAFILLFWNVSSQDLISFGVKGGLTYNADKGVIKSFNSSVADLESESKGSGSVGFHGGILMRAKFIGFFMQSELLYTGYHTEYELNGQSFDLKKKKLDLPITFGTHLFDIVHTQAGPVLSYYFEDKVTLSDIQNAEQDKFAVGFQLGAGVKLFQLLFDIRYEFGFGKIASSFINDSYAYQTENRPSFLHFSVSYLFD